MSTIHDISRILRFLKYSLSWQMLAQCLLVLATIVPSLCGLVCYMGTTLAHTLMQFSCQLVQLPMLAWILPMQNSCQLQTGTDVAPLQNSCQLQPPPELAWMLQHKQNSCQLWALPVSDQSWHRCCNARIVPEFDTGGGG